MVERHEVDLRLDVAGVLDQALAPVDEHPVEHLDERRVEVLARPLQAILEGAVQAEHLLVEAVEVLGVARLVDLLGGQEGLFALTLVGHHETRELRGHALLADEERGQVPRHLLAQLAVQARPVLLVLGEVDRVRLPVLALPQLIQLLRRHQRDGRQLGLVGDGADVTLTGEI